MKNLTKEDFWNEMKEKYPNSMKRFCDYIDEYKKSVQWDYLFSWNYHPGTSNPERHGQEDRRAKFHDLPLAMQMGIFMNWCGEYKLEECKAEIEAIFIIDEQL